MEPRPFQPGLLETAVPRLPHKRARATSRQVYREQRATDKVREAAGLETRRGCVLRLLAYYWNIRQVSPTASELFEFAEQRGERFRNVAELRPRLTELTEAGLIEPRGPRTCRVTGATVRTWAVREIGSQEPRP